MPSSKKSKKRFYNQNISRSRYDATAEFRLKGLAEFFLGRSDNEIDNAVKTGDLIEVYDEQTY